MTFLILILVNENKHHDADDREGHDGNRHCNPEKRISPFAVIGSYGQIIIIEVSK